MDIQEEFEREKSPIYLRKPYKSIKKLKYQIIFLLFIVSGLVIYADTASTSSKNQTLANHGNQISDDDIFQVISNSLSDGVYSISSVIGIGNGGKLDVSIEILSFTNFTP